SASIRVCLHCCARTLVRQQQLSRQHIPMGRACSTQMDEVKTSDSPLITLPATDARKMEEAAPRRRRARTGLSALRR
ncbi:MAG: hypothetical protein ACPIOQ_52405, partial [Promethearchaeia archaeon]